VAEVPAHDLAPAGVRRVGNSHDTLPAFDGTDVVLASDLAAKTATLSDCRVDAARVRSLPPFALPDETVHVRLWIGRDGRVTDSRVAATGAIGLDFLGCLKRQVRQWWLLPPAGGKGAFVDLEVELPARGEPRMRPLLKPVS
jgi:hypothetical protein